MDSSSGTTGPYIEYTTKEGRRRAFRYSIFSARPHVGFIIPSLFRVWSRAYGRAAQVPSPLLAKRREGRPAWHPAA